MIRRLALFFFALFLAVAPAWSLSPGQYLLLFANAPQALAGYVQSAVWNDYGYYGCVGSGCGRPASSNVGLISFWQRCNIATSGYVAPNECNVSGVFGNIGANSDEAQPGIIIVIDNAGGNYGTMRLNLNDSTGGNVSAHSCLSLAATPNNQPSDVWTHWLMAYDLSSSTPRSAIYRNGVLVSSACSTTTPTTPITVALNTDTGFALFPNNYTGTGKLTSGSPGGTEIADFFADFTSASCVMTGSAAATSTTCSGTSASTVPAGVIGKFYSSGAPVSLGANCASPLGAQPQFCFSGNKSNFYANQGSLTLTGWAPNSLTYSSTGTWPLYNAPCGAGLNGAILGNCGSHTVYQNWISSGSPSLSTSLTTTSGGNAISVGDLLILATDLLDTTSSTGNHNGATPYACPSGWSTISGSPVYDGASTLSMDTLVCWKIAVSADVSGGGAYTVSWTTTPTRAVQWELADYVGANASPIDASAQQTNASSTSLVAPSVSPVNGNDTLITLSFTTSQYAQTTIAPPASEDARFIAPGTAGVAPQIMFSDKVLSASGATGALTSTLGTARTSQAVSIAVSTN